MYCSRHSGMMSSNTHTHRYTHTDTHRERERERGREGERANYDQRILRERRQMDANIKYDHLDNHQGGDTTGRTPGETPGGQVAAH